MKHEETKNYYWVSTPIYKKYKTVRRYTHCEDCSQVTGSYTEKVGIGKPIRINWKRYKKDSMWYMNKTMEKVMMPRIIDSILSPTLSEKLGKGDKFNIPKI